MEDVRYFAAGQKYVSVHHRAGADLIDEPLRALASEFAGDFVRIHRNSLVSVRYVDSIERTAEGQYVVRMKGGDELLPVSRRHAPEALRQLRGAH
jgi:two-component system response regulator AlgR